VADVLADTSHLPAAEVAFTRGVLHTFTTAEGRAAFAALVARCLPAGVWLDLSGSADTPDPPGELASAVEPYFEVLSVRRAMYGLTPIARTSWPGRARCGAAPDEHAWRGRAPYDEST
jgi:hypothetical protein